jgi:hypothetical protein
VLSHRATLHGLSKSHLVLRPRQLTIGLRAIHLEALQPLNSPAPRLLLLLHRRCRSQLQRDPMPSFEQLPLLLLLTVDGLLEEVGRDRLWCPRTLVDRGRAHAVDLERNDIEGRL